VWRNDGRGVLLDSSEKLEIVADTLLAVAPVAADFDGDGDLDLACVSQDSTVVVRWNEGGNTNRRLLVTLAGPRGPGDGFGARLELHGGSLVQNVEVDEQPVWLGAQRATHLDVVRIAWRDGTVENRFEVDIPPAGTWHFTRSAGR
jgi:hypothetical protein